MLAIVGLIVILIAGIVANVGALSTASTRRADSRFRREMAFINRDRDARLEHQARADGATDPAS